jgi:hypothetical protein
MKGLSLNSNRKRVKIKRPGVHAKTKTSRLKGSTNYIKKYKGQGR